VGIEQICGRGLGDRALRAAVLSDLRHAVPFDAYAWLLTDPETCVGTSPLAEFPSPADLPTLVRLKYLTATNRWTTLVPGAASTLLTATGGDPSRSSVWRELLAGYGITDVASLVFGDQFGCWGWLDLWRTDGSFTPDECNLLGGLDQLVTPALRRSLATTFAVDPSAHQAAEPVVLLLSVDLQPMTQTPLVDGHLRALLPTDAGRAPIPAAAYNVAAQLLAREQGIDDHAPSARAHQADGDWVTVSAARLGDARPGPAGIAVSIAPTSPTERSELFARVIGLSTRESELLRHLVAGHDTREVTQLMFLSAHTVQDHLKSIFAKAGVHNRRLLVARATGMA
jgi:DNA-binding CsgD family transcriptional regulator